MTNSDVGEVFSYDEDSVYSVYTQRGMLMFGRHVGDTSYPYTWSWKGWSYEDGSVFYNNSFETEFSMRLTDWSDQSIVTPRAMSYLYTDDETIAFTQRSHRGVNVMSYKWNQQDVKGNKIKWKSSCGAQKLGISEFQNIMLCGSKVGGVLVTCHAATLTLRDMDTGVKIRDIKLESESYCAMCVDSIKIVLINRDLSSKEAIIVIKME